MVLGGTIKVGFRPIITDGAMSLAIIYMAWDKHQGRENSVQQLKPSNGKELV